MNEWKKEIGRLLKGEVKFVFYYLGIIGRGDGVRADFEFRVEPDTLSDNSSDRVWFLCMTKGIDCKYVRMYI